MKVLLLHDVHAAGGRPDEADGLVQAEHVADALGQLGHETAARGMGLDLAEAAAMLRDEAPDLVFNLVEAVDGHGRLIHLAPALLDALGIPYTGATTEAMFLGSHKLLTKKALVSAGLPTPPWVDAESEGGPPRFPGAYIVKSVWEDASVGLDDDSIVTAEGASSLREEIRARSRGLGGDAYAEAFVEGREFNLSLLHGDGGPQVLPPAEMCFDEYPPGKPRLVGYRAKWDPQSFEYSHTVRRFVASGADDDLVGRLRRLAAACWDLFGLRGYARVDFRVSEDGRPWILEINPNPCLSPDAGFIAAAQQAGSSLVDVVARIVDAAQKDRHEDETTARDDSPPQRAAGRRS